VRLSILGFGGKAVRSVGKQFVNPKVSRLRPQRFMTCGQNLVFTNPLEYASDLSALDAQEWRLGNAIPLAVTPYSWVKAEDEESTRHLYSNHGSTGIELSS
jgi:hypothetical protein